MELLTVVVGADTRDIADEAKLDEILCLLLAVIPGSRGNCKRGKHSNKRKPKEGVYTVVGSRSPPDSRPHHPPAIAPQLPLFSF